jgi:hypothetical protein
MNRLNKFSFTVIALGLLFCFNSCSLSIMTYIRNLSQSPLTVILQYPSRGMSENASISFSNKIVEINKETYKILKDSLQVKRIDSLSISFIVPGNSTAQLWPGISTNSPDVNLFKAIVTQNEFSDTIILTSTGKLKMKSNTIGYYDFQK